MCPRGRLRWASTPPFPRGPPAWRARRSIRGEAPPRSSPLPPAAVPPPIRTVPHQPLLNLLPFVPASKATGISISDELLSLYEEVKLRHKHKYFSFSLQKTGQVGVKVTDKVCAAPAFSTVPSAGV